MDAEYLEFKTSLYRMNARQTLPREVLTSDVFYSADRAGAAITCGVLTDYGIITDGNTTQVIGPRKIHNADTNLGWKE